MASVAITHSKVVTVPDDGQSPVGSDEWNATHVVTGLENVDNTSDANKPVSTAQAAADAVVASNAAAAIALKLNISNPTFTGSITSQSTNAGMELGSVSVSNTPFIDFHSSGNNIDYDARIIASGGTGVGGNGVLNVHAAALIADNELAAYDGVGNYHILGFSGTPGGYNATYTLNGTGLIIGHNSSARTLELQTASTTRLTISGGGDVSIPGNLSASNPSFTGAIGLNSHTLIVSSGGYASYYNGDGSAQTFISGGTGDPTNYYRNTQHSLQTPGGTYTLLAVSDGLIALRASNGTPTTVNIGVANVTGANIVIAGGTSGSQTWAPPAVASGTATMFAGTDTVVGRATTDTLTNKTLTSPALTGTPTAPTATAGTNTTQVATTAFVQSALTGSVTLSSASNVLGADVLLNNIASYFTGPSMAQGTSGTWFASGTVTCTDTVAAGIVAKLWDGTTVVSSARAFCTAGGQVAISLSGIFTNPAGNIRISVEDVTNTSGKILFNLTGNSKDSSIFGIRIA